MKILSYLGMTVIVLAIATSSFLATFGWFAIGFGTMTDCTNTYNCTTTGCAPCTTAERWINLGAGVQFALAALGVGGLAWGACRGRGRHLVLAGTVLLVLSVVTIACTTRLATTSY